MIEMLKSQDRFIFIVRIDTALTMPKYEVYAASSLVCGVRVFGSRICDSYRSSL